MLRPMNMPVPAQAFAVFQPAYWQIDGMQRKFVDGYVADLEKIADRSGKRLSVVLHEPFPYELDGRGMAMLALPLVRAAIAERVRELSDLYDVSVSKTLRELTNIAYSNISNYIEIDELSGEPTLNLTKCTPEQLSAIKSFEFDDKPRGGRKIKFQLHDKLGALNSMARYQGLFADDNEHYRQNNSPAATRKPVPTLPAGIDNDQAATLYQRMLEADD